MRYDDETYNKIYTEMCSIYNRKSIKLSDDIKYGIDFGLTKLPIKYRCAISLRFAQNYTLKEVGSALDISGTRVSQIIRKGLSLLYKGWYARYGYEYTTKYIESLPIKIFNIDEKNYVLRDIPLELLDLPTKIYYCIRAYWCNKIGDGDSSVFKIMDFGLDNLNKIQNINNHTINDIKECIIKNASVKV